MAEIRCPHCGKVFNVDNAEMGNIIAQIRDGEFESDVQKRVEELSRHMAESHQKELEALESRLRLEGKESSEAEIEKLREQLRNEQTKTSALQSEVANAKVAQENAVLKATRELEERNRDLEREKEAIVRESQVNLQAKENEVAFYRDLKARMSTKMVGETLEQHCETEFNRIRMAAYPNAYFEKDNRVSAASGSKGDYIFTEFDSDGNEIISIMFEMKNENDTTATKHKNEDFFKELDKDRKEKGCEYAVLVSMLEADSDLYNGGIVDVSYKYDKMYVVRPQCFLAIISLLRNAALSAMQYKRELAEVREQNIDITNFEQNLEKFKEDFGKNYERAHGRFDKAIEEIDKTIANLEKVKSELLGSDRQLRIATSKVDEVTIKRLTKDSPSLRAQFDAMHEGEPQRKRRKGKTDADV